MKIVIVATEAVPFCKTGGLGDVCGSLPLALARLGLDVCVVMPAFREALESEHDFICDTGKRITVPIGHKTVTGGIFESRFPGSEVPVYLLRQDGYFNRPHLYQTPRGDYLDNCERFVFHCRGALEAIRALELAPDLIHAHDWTSGLVPAYLKTLYAGLPGLDSAASVFTIHNLAYQGNFWHWDMELTGIDWQHFNWREMEFYGNLNFMKSAIAFADRITTVSPTYAREIQSPPSSCGLEGVLAARRNDMSGIVNGIDTDAWNPATDVFTASEGYAHYDVETFPAGKAACKQALQSELGLRVDPAVPLVGIVGRLATQKGWDLIVPLIRDRIDQSPIQWAILGTGEQEYHDLLADLAQQRPGQVAARLEFSNPLAHRIEAGSDFFLMPSRYEPCGLNQLYSLRYGTVPIVRSTGGLADTVTDTTPQSLQDRSATGFTFAEYHLSALHDALARALDTFADRETFQQIISNGMRQDWSWERSARNYVALYDATIACRMGTESLIA